MSRYAIWDKQSPILTPVGKVFTAEQWIERYPIAGLETIKVVCAGGEINGAFFGTLGQMKEMHSKNIDFSACVTDQGILDAIEAYEDAQNAPSNEVSNEELTATSLASIAASLEFQNMMALPDEEV